MMVEMEETSARTLHLLETGIKALEGIITKHEYKLERVTELLTQVTREQEKSNMVLLGDGNGDRSLKVRVISLEHFEKAVNHRLGHLEDKSNGIEIVIRRMVDDELGKRTAVAQAEELKQVRAAKSKAVWVIIGFVGNFLLGLFALLAKGGNQ